MYGYLSEKSFIELGRERARKLYPQPRPCELCGKSPEDDRIFIHHKDEDTFNNDISNLQWLCPACHLKVHDYHRASTVGRTQEVDSYATRTVRRMRKDTDARSGDKCPECGMVMRVIQTFYSRKDETHYTYIGCNTRYGGCGYRAGSYVD